MKTTAYRSTKYNLNINARVANLHLASMTVVCQSDADARLQLSNALFLIGEAVTSHEQDVMQLAAASPFQINIEVTPYRVD